MLIKREYLIIAVVIVLFLATLVCGVLTDWFGTAVDNTVDFVQEQQPGADSAGELIGMQYSQLRELSVALDTMSCQLNTNDAEISDLREQFGTDEFSWPSDARSEIRNLREYRRGVLQRYAAVAAQYNNLRSDIRTLPDNLGLTVEEIPQAEELSPIKGMCGNFALPEP